MTPGKDKPADGANALSLRDFAPPDVHESSTSPGGRFLTELSLRAEALHLWRGDRHVLRGVSLELRGGEVLQLTGPNGAGKTSLLRTLCGLMYPEEGRVLWRGEDVRKDLRAYHSQLAYMGHEPPLKADLTPRENLRFWAGVRRPLTQGDIEQMLDRVGADDEWRDRPVRTLSAGQKRRVALAGLALLAVPLWLLDEPTTNLDAAGREMVSRMIDEHVNAGGLAIAAVHHELTVSSPMRRLELATP